MTMMSKLLMLACSIQVSCMAMQMNVEIIDKNNVEENESQVRIAQAKDLFQLVHDRYQKNYPEGTMDRLFNGQLQEVKDGKARLFLAINNGALIANIFTVYNEPRNMVQLRILGYDESVGQENVIKAIKKIVNYNIDFKSCGVCCCTNKMITHYHWLFEGTGLRADPLLFRDGENFTPDKYDWYVVRGSWKVFPDDGVFEEKIPYFVPDAVTDDLV